MICSSLYLLVLMSAILLVGGLHFHYLGTAGGEQVRAAVAQHAAEGLPEAQAVPQRGQQPGVTHAQRGIKAHGREIDAFGSGRAADAHQAAHEGIGAPGAHVLEAAEGGDDALAGGAPVITEGFHDLHVGAAFSACDANEHGTNYRSGARGVEGVNENIVSLQKFRRLASKCLIPKAQATLWGA